jgi:hypothetical protein
MATIKVLLIPESDIDFEDWSRITNRNITEKTFDSLKNLKCLKLKEFIMRKHKLVCNFA